MGCLCESAVGRGPRIVPREPGGFRLGGGILEVEEFAWAHHRSGPTRGLYVPIPVFRSLMLGPSPNYVNLAISPAIRTAGNRVVAAALLMNSSAGFQLALQGSHDGKAWVDLASAPLGPPMGHVTVGVGGGLAPLSYAWVRVRLGGARALVHATVVFSEI